MPGVINLRSPSQKEREERRASSRHPCDLHGICGPYTPALALRRWSAKALDLSSSGVSLLLERRFEPGTSLLVRVAEGKEGCTRTLVARVVRVKEQCDGTWILGCALRFELGGDELTELVQPAPVSTRH
jgi:hypothetical protein